MNITLKKTDDVNALLTVKVDKADYEGKVQASLKKLKQQAKMPGFRQGMVPMSLIQKMYGLEVKADELQKLISESINNYIKEEKLELLTSPLTAESEEKVDVTTADDVEMKFELALAPTFSIDLAASDKMKLYQIEVTDEMVDNQIKMYRDRAGKFEEVADYLEGDMLRGSLVELDDKGKTKRGGLKIDDASLMPQYFVSDDQKKLFDGAKKKDAIVMNVAEAYKGREAEISSLLKIQKEEVEKYQGDFKYTISTITRRMPAEMNQEFFDGIYGKDVVKTEEEMREKVKAEQSAVYEEDANYKFVMDLKDYCMEKVGELKFPEALMKRELLLRAETDEQKAEVEKDFPTYLKERQWTLICSQLIEKLGVKVEDTQVEEAAKLVARSQFAQYGITNVPAEYVDNYAKEMLKDEKQLQRFINRAIEVELVKKVKAVVTLENEAISVEKFNAFFEN